MPGFEVKVSKVPLICMKVLTVLPYHHTSETPSSPACRFTGFCPYYHTSDFPTFDNITLRDGTRMPCPREYIEALARNHSALMDVSTEQKLFIPLVKQTQWK